jgi:hypothetical protein
LASLKPKACLPARLAHSAAFVILPPPLIQLLDASSKNEVTLVLLPRILQYLPTPGSTARFLKSAWYFQTTAKIKLRFCNKLQNWLHFVTAF